MWKKREIRGGNWGPFTVACSICFLYSKSLWVTTSGERMQCNVSYTVISKITPMFTLTSHLLPNGFIFRTIMGSLKILEQPCQIELGWFGCPVPATIHTSIPAYSNLNNPRDWWPWNLATDVIQIHILIAEIRAHLCCFWEHVVKTPACVLFLIITRLFASPGDAASGRTQMLR